MEKFNLLVYSAGPPVDKHNDSVVVVQMIQLTAQFSLQVVFPANLIFVLNICETIVEQLDVSGS